jgi:hypothetical protein
MLSPVTETGKYRFTGVKEKPTQQQIDSPTWDRLKKIADGTGKAIAYTGWTASRAGNVRYLDWTSDPASEQVEPSNIKP